MSFQLHFEAHDSTFNVNAIAPFFIAQEFLPSMIRRRKGHIVNVASVLGLVGAAQMSEFP